MTTNTQRTTPRTPRRLVAAMVAGGVAIAGVTAAVTMTLGTPAAHAEPDAAANSSSSSTSHHHTHHDVAPSQSTKTLQSQLAQLNYYNGPLSGYVNGDTIHAIEYLQRAAGLPQTGTMNPATQAALSYQLAHGDSQMGG